MLLSFSVKNFGPYREQAVLDLRSVPAHKDHPENLIDVPGAKGSCHAVRTVAVYGANASGKSQLVHAYRAFRTIVLGSFASTTAPSDPMNVDETSVLARFYNPYAFSGKLEDVEFEVEFAVEDGTYRYGFTYDSDMVTSEWMYFTSAGSRRQSMILERFEEFELGASVRDECERHKYLVGDSTLALSVFSRMKLKTPRFHELLACIEGIFPYASPSHVNYIDGARALFKHELDDETRRSLLAFLHAVDVGIKDIEVEVHDGKAHVKTLHVGEDGALHKLPLELESDGTIKAITIFFLIIRAARAGNGLFVDELTSELHPLLARYLAVRKRNETVLFLD